MRQVGAATTNAWRARVKAGDRQPVARATIQHSRLRRTPYDTRNAPGGDYDYTKDRKGTFTSLMFGGNETVYEVPNIRSVSWSRSVDQDIAECTITILNAELDPMGMVQSSPDWGKPGAFTFGVGKPTAAAAERWPWMADRSAWTYVMAPDRLVRTYEGYGCDTSKAPGFDEHMHQSGTWLVDDVEFNSRGDLILKARDLGRLLLDQIAYPPVVAWADYPLEWSKIRSDQVEARQPTGGKWKTPRGTTRSSNDKYVGKGIQDKPKYVGPAGSVQGHYERHALDGTNKTYWMSTGQARTFDKVWWEIDLDKPQDIAAVEVNTKQRGTAKVFVSLYKNGRWLGQKKINYKVSTEGVNLHADIKYVRSFTPGTWGDFQIALKRKYKDVEKIRLTFTGLSGIDSQRITHGTKYHFRAALQNFRIYAGQYSKLGFKNGTVEQGVGNISEISHAIKWVCAWAGFFWPGDADKDYIRYSNDDPPVHYNFPDGNRDFIFPKGRVWGSWQATGTAPVADVTADNFDKQPLWETVSYFRDITGFLAFTDENGRFTWRAPNIFRAGNWVHPHHLDPAPRVLPRTQSVIEIDEDELLLDYTARLSGKNQRERVAVTDARGDYGAVIRSYDPPGPKTGLRRLAYWSDRHFESNQEALVAADMVAARQMLDYRRGKVTIWGNPAIQIDDQIRIFERVTNESYYHYVAAISSTLDMDSGTWEYDLETHWLGEEREDAWLIDVEKLRGATRTYLNNLGSPGA